MTTSSTLAATRRARSRRRSGYLVLALLLTLFGTAYAALAPGTRAAENTPSADDVQQGRSIFLVGCSTCHGLHGQGSSIAPSLIGVGAAAVDFQVGTGRMPLVQQGAQAPRKPPTYKPEEIRQLAAYVASLAPGPAIPANADVDVAKGNSARGGQLFRLNCAQCHNFNGSGGALTEGKWAPSLYSASARQIYEAMVTGPENMPVFGDGQISPEDKRDIIAFVKSTHAQADPGGFALGRLGPVPEGLVIWVVGTMVLVLSCLWIGARV